MTALLVTPELDMSLVQRRGVMTVPIEDATVSCWCLTGKPCKGLTIGNLPLKSRRLDQYALEMGKRMIERLGVRGYQHVGGLGLHGPWESYEFNQKLVDIEAQAFKEAQKNDDPSLVLPFILERDGTSPYSDYLLVGNFLYRNVLTEVVVKEEPDDN